MSNHLTGSIGYSNFVANQTSLTAALPCTEPQRSPGPGGPPAGSLLLDLGPEGGWRTIGGRTG